MSFVRIHLRTAEVFCAALPLLACGISAAAEPAESAEFFEKRIRPVLSEQCYKCHSSTSEKLKGGLMLDSREAVLKGGDTGPAITPGDPEKSLLVEAIRWKNTDMQMPPKKALAPHQVADIEAWVKAGAPWPQEAGAKVATKKAFDLQQRRQEHWCWQPVLNSPVPAVKNSAWPRTDADRFILAKLEEKGLKPAPDASPEVLVRRLSFAITGLPPSPEQAEKFVREFSAPAAEDKERGRQGDKGNEANLPLSLSPPLLVSPRSTEQQQALEHLVDSLLASPHFGERWARHWLDLVRYAETRGHEFDINIPNAWQYRDYVVRALNADVPYDRFVTEHIAGDLLPAPRLNPATGANESILGTGFWFLGEEIHSPVDIRQDEADRMDNRLDVMTKTFLGMTVACARCHDHKFDAISQRDYYALAGFLISSTYRQARFETLEPHRQIAAQLDQLRTNERAKILKAVAQSLRPGIERTATSLLSAREALQGTGKRVHQTSLWAEELKKARNTPEHPLHAFAKVTLQMQGDDSAEFVSDLSPILTTWQKQRLEAAGAAQPDDIVVDYAKPGPRDWVQDGWSFGARPARVGDPLFGSSEEQPVTGFATRAAAIRDATWSGLAVKQSDRDEGKLGAWERGEQTLRTPDVTLRAGSLWYLARGSVRAYAAVDSHALIRGPLHGALLKEAKDEHNQWRWVEHKLTDYNGHRLHVEFSPVGAEPLAIAMVVQSDAKPSLPDAPNELLLNALSDPDVTTPRAMAGAMENVFSHIAELMAADGLSNSANASDAAELANWLVQNSDLFCPPGCPERKQLAAAAKPFVAAQAQLASRIQPSSQTAPAMLDGSGVDEFLLVRGQSRNPGERTPRRFIEAIAGTEQPKFSTGSGRLELAQQMIAPSNPFTARVIVNRVWHHLFGRGIVPTVDNFGVLGQPPSHRELLDHLAVRFVGEQGWSVKQLIRELVLSRTFAMSSAPADAAAEQADPENLLLHRANLRRLEGEAIRDAILAVSGRLDPKVGGPSVPVHLTPFMDGRGKPKISGPLDGDGRRSLYISVRRNFLQPMLLAFDAPIPFTAMGRRNVSNVPAQALILMNDPFVVEQAAVWAKKLTPITDPGERVREMYLAAFSRPPDKVELQDALAFINEQSKRDGTTANDERVWADLCHVLFNVKDFIYLN